MGSLRTFTLQKNRFLVSLTIKNYYNYYDSAVGIVTRHGLEGAGFKPRHGQDIFSSPKTRPAMVTTQRPIQWVPGFHSGGWAAEAWSWPPLPSAEVKNDWNSTSAPLYTFMGSTGSSLSSSICLTSQQFSCSQNITGLDDQTFRTHCSTKIWLHGM